VKTELHGERFPIAKTRRNAAGVGDGKAAGGRRWAMTECARFVKPAGAQRQRPPFRGGDTSPMVGLAPAPLLPAGWPECHQGSTRSK